MSRIAYVNGRYLRHAEAGVSIDDRAFVFGDGVYEVCEVRGGAPDRRAASSGAARPLARRACGSPRPSARRRCGASCARSSRATACATGSSICRSRAARARRDHGFPAAARPGLVVTAKSLDPRLNEARAASGVKVVTAPDERWAHPAHQDPATSAQCARQAAAREAGAFETWFVGRRRLRHRGRLDQRLDRDAPRNASSRADRRARSWPASPAPR